jgi:hypothetical protein
VRARPSEAWQLTKSVCGKIRDKHGLILWLRGGQAGDKPVVPAAAPISCHIEAIATRPSLTIAAAEKRSQSGPECLPFRNESSLGFND